MASNFREDQHARGKNKRFVVMELRENAKIEVESTDAGRIEHDEMIANGFIFADEPYGMHLTGNPLPSSTDAARAEHDEMIANGFIFADEPYGMHLTGNPLPSSTEANPHPETGGGSRPDGTLGGGPGYYHGEPIRKPRPETGAPLPPAPTPETDWQRRERLSNTQRDARVRMLRGQPPLGAPEPEGFELSPSGPVTDEQRLEGQRASKIRDGERTPRPEPEGAIMPQFSMVPAHEVQPSMRFKPEDPNFRLSAAGGDSSPARPARWTGVPLDHERLAIKPQPRPETGESLPVHPVPGGGFGPVPLEKPSPAIAPKLSFRDRLRRR